MGRSVTYSDRENVIVEAGPEAIEKILSGTDMAAKERLLLCLDRYMDPWFGYNLSYLSEIELLLEQVIAGTNTISVKEDAINLLCDYSYPPFPILAESLGQIEEELKPDVRYLLNMDKEM